MTAGYMPIPYFYNVDENKRPCDFCKTIKYRKTSQKEGNDYYQTIVKYISKIKVQGTTVEKV